MKHEKSCGAVILKEKQVLIVQQASGFYNFPKGHMEKGETEEEAVIREVKEETNLDIKINNNMRFPIIYSQTPELKREVIYFIASPISNDIQIDEKELKDAKWIDIDEVESILTFENLKELWRQIKASIR